MRKNVLIIGSGLGGLAISCRLAARGFKVNLVEKNSVLGGKTMNHRIGGYSFQIAPSFITYVDPLVALFQSIGRDIDDYLMLAQLDPFYRVFFEDGRGGVYVHEKDSLPVLIMNDGTREILTGNFYHNVTGKNMYYSLPKNRIQGLAEWVKLRVSPLFDSYSAKTVEQMVLESLGDPFLAATIYAPLLFIGCDPSRITMRYALRNHLLFPKNMYYPLGGFCTLIDGLTNLLIELGGNIIRNAEVDQILINRKRAAGVRLLDGRKLYADYVINDADQQHTYTKLLRDTSLPILRNKLVNQIQPGPSFFVFCFGMRKQYPDAPLCHHNFFISDGFSHMLRDIYQKNVFSNELFFYLQQPTITDSSLAPAGGSIFQVYIPVPNMDAQVDWHTMFNIYRDQIIKFIEETLIPDFRKDIAVDLSLIPADYVKRYNLTSGATFHSPPGWLERTGLLSWIHTGIENLFMVGDGSYPGWGITSVLEAARVVDEIIPS